MRTDWIHPSRYVAELEAAMADGLVLLLARRDEGSGLVELRVGTRDEREADRERIAEDRRQRAATRPA